MGCTDYYASGNYRMKRKNRRRQPWSKVCYHRTICEVSYCVRSSRKEDIVLQLISLPTTKDLSLVPNLCLQSTHSTAREKQLFTHVGILFHWVFFPFVGTLRTAVILLYCSPPLPFLVIIICRYSGKARNNGY